MAHIRQQIREHVVTVLRAALGDSCRVYDSRVPPASIHQLPCANVCSAQDDMVLPGGAPSFGGPLMERHYTFAVIINVFSPTTINATMTTDGTEIQIDSLSEVIEQTLFENPTMGGLCKGLSLVRVQFATLPSTSVQCETASLFLRATNYVDSRRPNLPR